MTMSSTLQKESLIGGESRRIVVGYDGTPGASNAVDWAALEAAAREWPLCIVSSATDSEVPPDAAPRIAERLQDNLGISVSVTDRAAGTSLIEGVNGNDLFVLGPGLPSCSVPSLQRCVPPTASRRSPCPVVMVRGSFSPRIRRILLGVDGSSASQTAIEWACSEAAVHRAEVLVVHVSEPDSAPERGDRIVEEAVDDCQRRIGNAAVELAVPGSPRSLLVALTRERDLVVVGSRGPSGFKTALFGSVAVALAEHAYCPVVITQPQAKRHECISRAPSTAPSM